MRNTTIVSGRLVWQNSRGCLFPFLPARFVFVVAWEHRINPCQINKYQINHLAYTRTGTVVLLYNIIIRCLFKYLTVPIQYYYPYTYYLFFEPFHFCLNHETPFNSTNKKPPHLSFTKYVVFWRAEVDTL